MNLRKRLIKYGSIGLASLALLTISNCEQRKSYIYDQKYYESERKKDDQKDIEDLVCAREKMKNELKNPMFATGDTSDYRRKIKLIDDYLKEKYKEGEVGSSYSSDGYLDQPSEF